MSIRIEVLPDLAINHVLGAALFARQARSAQDRRLDGAWDKLPESERQATYADHRAYVMGSIFCAVGFTECSINDLFSKAVELPRILKELSTDIVRALAAQWMNSDFEKEQTLKKFNRALMIAGKKPLGGGGIYADMVDLILLRNTLTHFKAKQLTTVDQIDPEAVTVTEFEQRLSKKPFPLNPFLSGDANPFFPDKCLGHGCAKWAVTTSIRFVDGFFGAIGMTPPYDHERSRLNCE